MIKLRILRWGDYPGLSAWALNVVMRVPVKGKQEVQRRVEVMTEARVESCEEGA